MFGVWFHWSHLDEQGADVEQAEFFGTGACLIRLNGSAARLSAAETPGSYLAPAAQGCATASLSRQPHAILSSSDARALLRPHIQWRGVHYHALRLTHVGSELPRQASRLWASLKRFLDPFVYVFFRNRLAVRLPHA
jgi:hypothetical protein